MDEKQEFTYAHYANFAEIYTIRRNKRLVAQVYNEGFARQIVTACNAFGPSLDLLRRCGCYLSATMTMYDRKEASELKRRIDAILATAGVKERLDETQTGQSTHRERPE